MKERLIKAKGNTPVRNPPVSGAPSESQTSADAEQLTMRVSQKKPKPPAIAPAPYAQMTLAALDKATQADALNDDWDNVKAPKKLLDGLVEVTEVDDLACVRVQCTMNASLSSILAVIARAEGAPKGTKTEIVQSVNKDLCVMRICVSLPFISDREFISCQWVDRRESRTTKVVSVSLPKEMALGLCPKQKKYVRGNVSCLSICTLVF